MSIQDQLDERDIEYKLKKLDYRIKKAIYAILFEIHYYLKALRWSLTPSTSDSINRFKSWIWFIFLAFMASVILILHHQ